MPHGIPLFTLDLLLDRRKRLRNQAWIRGLANSISLEDGTSICRVLGRYKMLVDTRDVGVSSHLQLDGYWEMWLTEALAEVIRPGMIVADIGSNLGYFSLLMAELVGQDGHVHAFDPNPAMVDRARRSARLNGFAKRITVHDQALGETDGAEVRLTIPHNEPGGGHISAALDETPAELRLKTRRFDSYSELLAADIIKIDAEGAEEAIWRGMEGRFAYDRPLIVFMEFASLRYRDPASFLAAVRTQGFSIALLDFTKGVQPITIDRILAHPADEEQMLVLRR